MEELRNLMHLMIESITIDPETRNPADITIKFNPVLTNYLGIDLEEEVNKASSFSFANKKELIFTVNLQNIFTINLQFFKQHLVFWWKCHRSYIIIKLCRLFEVENIVCRM